MRGKDGEFKKANKQNNSSKAGKWKRGGEADRRRGVNTGMKARAKKKKSWWDEEKKKQKTETPHHVNSSYELPFPAFPSLVSKPSGAEFSCRQTGCFTSTILQLPVTLTVVGFKSDPALELPGYTWRRAIKKRQGF